MLCLFKLYVAEYEYVGIQLLLFGAHQRAADCVGLLGHALRAS